MQTDIESHLKTICELDIHELARKTNVWWRDTGGDGRDLVIPFDIANQVYRWALETGRPVRINHDHPSVIYGELGAAWDAEREAFKAEARRFVMETATWRRIVLEDPTLIPPQPEPKTRALVGSKGARS